MKVIVVALTVLVAATVVGCSDSAPEAQQGGSLPLAPLQTMTISTTEGTWMSLDVSPDGRTIAFDLLGNIFSLPITGGRARQLTEGPAFNQRPKFSPDGRYLVFTSDRGGYNQLWRMPAGGGAPTLVPAQDTAGYRLVLEQNYPFFDTTAAVFRSPGGRYEIRKWSAQQPPQQEVLDCPPRDFVLTDWVTGQERRLAPAGSDCGAELVPGSAFTPDARAFITAHSGKLWRIEVPSGEATSIPFRADVRLRVRPYKRFQHRVAEDSLVHARRLAEASLSFDGSRVAFTAFNRIWTAAVGSDAAKLKPAARRLTSLETGEFWPAWSPDGQYVAFVTWTDDGGGQGAIYRMRADGTGSAERLTTKPGRYEGLAYSSDGARIFAVLHTAGGNVGPEIDVGREVPDVQIVSVPGTGGVVTRHNRAVWKKQSCCQKSTGLHALPHGAVPSGTKTADRVGRFESIHETWGPWLEPSKADALPRPSGAVLSVATDGSNVPADTALKVLTPPVRDRQWRYRPWYRLQSYVVDDIVLSPTREHALVVVDGRKLFLVEIPKAQESGPPIVTLDPASAGVHLVTPIRSGAEFPRWQADGRAFTYVFGNTIYRYELPAAKGGSARRSQFTIDVTAPRDLPRGTLALRNARLITMRGDEVIERGDLVIRDRRIIAVGPAGTVAIPDEAHVVDAMGTTIIPGLVDAHDHNRPPRGVMRSRMWPYEANLGYGVLTSRDPQEFFSVFLSYEDQLATGELLGPRYMSTGPGIGEPSHDPINSLEDAREVVARYADVYRVLNLKEYTTFRREVRQWLIMAAAERGMNVGSHGDGSVGHQLVQNAIDGYAQYDHTSMIGVPVYQDVRQLLVRSGITLAHINWYKLGSFFAARLTNAEWARMERLSPPHYVQGWRDVDSHDSDPRAKPAEPHWRQHENMAQLVAEGGRVATGGHGDPSGIGTHMQLWAFIEGGMPRLEAIRAATLRGAEVLGLDQDLGSLEVGKLGDVVILEGNPLENIRYTAAIRSIVFNGRLRDGLTLDELWPRARPVPPAQWVANEN